MELTNRVAIVTGAASGIGAASALRLAASGARVAVADIDDDAGGAVVTRIQQRGGQAIYRHCDVASFGHWAALTDEVLGRFGRIDIVHNNAAYGSGRGPTHELPEAEWDLQLAVSLKSIFLSVKACMPSLISARGSMINTSSVHALFGFPHRAAYDAAKGGVCSLTRELAAEYGPDVRVNAVLPGAISTPALEGVGELELSEHAWQAPAKRLGSPDEVAAVVCFLASDDASFITGASIVVDGGWSIAKYYRSAERP